tara:strand:- start:893 stop:1135 length:243 start_codon:yes stop_codon:yes gene_type:complete
MDGLGAKDILDYFIIFGGTFVAFSGAWLYVDVKQKMEDTGAPPGISSAVGLGVAAVPFTLGMKLSQSVIHPERIRPEPGE